ncbi:hypothetical protein M9Y10_012082 [Tritrichomonas musculus]|uniref:Uncharacterized protein n=1 Tax=Tritrichomonas musculus TaxID=1915356 RepID=A0ABR2IBK7_9EUKA
MPPKRNKKPTNVAMSINEQTKTNINNAFENARSGTEKDRQGNPAPLYKDDQLITEDSTKILMIQQAITESIKKGDTLLARGPKIF